MYIFLTTDSSKWNIGKVAIIWLWSQLHKVGGHQICGNQRKEIDFNDKLNLEFT